MNGAEHLTDQAALATLGERLAQYRLERDFTQARLAREAGISKRTLIRLEAGESTQLTTLVRVLRVLDLLGNLDLLVPAPAASPLKKLQEEERRRKRASGKSGNENSDDDEWSWGDET